MSSIKIYSAPHKGLRNILAKFVTMSGKIDYSNESELNNLKLLGNEMFMLLENHAYTENNFTLTSLDFKVSGASEHDREEHIKILKIQKKLASDLNNLTIATPLENGHQFYLQATYFQSEYLYHLFEEETETEPIIVEHFTEDELIRNRYDVLTKMNFEILLIWMKYIMEVQSVNENLAMLTDCKNIFESPKFIRIMDVVKNALSENDYRLILIDL
jgi:hypothetical protein